MNTNKGLSLVGFMTELDAVGYCRNVCHFEDLSDAALRHEWSVAKSRIGGPMGKMGRPEVLDLPSEMTPHMDLLMREAWFQHKLQDSLKGAEFKLIEIDPLLAMQFAINTDRSEHLGVSYTKSRSVQELLDLCLPLTQPNHEVEIHKDQKASGSLMLMTKNLSLGIDRDGAHVVETHKGSQVFVGVEVSTPAPLLHVVCYQDLYYLHNGFHRAYSARLAGATHIPCILRNVTYSADIGIGADTFGLEVLQSNNPPTVGHFTQGRAHPVRLKSLTKIIQVSWAEYMV
jgi:hypothetical protein